jgi:iron complex outermembrane recepter protein
MLLPFRITQKALTAAIVASGAISLTAQAAPQLEEVIVTAQKKEQSLQDVSISVAVTSGDEISSKAITTIENLSASLPGIQIAENVLNQYLFVRGIGTPGINQGQEQAVGMFTDGIYMGRAALARAPMMDINRVEVLRGPQSIFYGKNTTAGAIGVYTNDPTNEFEGKVTALYESNDNERELNLSLSGPLSETVAARLSLRKYNLDGYFENTGSGDDSPMRDDMAARVKLLWDISDSETLKLSYEHNKFERQGSLIQLTGYLDPLAPASSQQLYGLAEAINGGQFSLDNKVSTGNQAGSQLDLTPYGLSNLALDSSVPNNDDNSDATSNVFITTYEKGLTDHQLTVIYGYAEYESEDAVSAHAGPLPLIDADLQDDYTQHSFEVRLSSTNSETVEYVVGLFYQAADVNFTEADGFGIGVLNPGAPNLSRIYTLDQQTETAALFGSVTWNHTDALRTVYGLRIQNEKKDATHTNDHYISGGTIAEYDMLEQINPDQNGNGTGDYDEINFVYTSSLGSYEHNFADKISKDSALWSVKAEYDYSDTGMAYAGASTGSKAGGFDARYVGQSKDELKFGDETAVNLEAGVRENLFDGRMRVSATVFQTDISDYQVSVYDGNVNFLVQNAAELRSRGLELEADLAVTDNLTINTAFAYLDSKWTDYKNGSCSMYAELRGIDGCSSTVKTRDMTGKESLFAPKTSANVSFVYSRDFRDLTFGSILDVNYSDKFATAIDLDPNMYYDSWVTYDLRLSVSDINQTWEVALVGKNLTDEEKGSSKEDAPFIDGAYFGQLDRLSSVAIQATYNF